MWHQPWAIPLGGQWASVSPLVWSVPRTLIFRWIAWKWARVLSSHASCVLLKGMCAFLKNPSTNTLALQTIPAPSFTPSVSMAGNYFGPHLSAALHKVVMRLCQTDVLSHAYSGPGIPQGHWAWGWNSSLIWRDTFWVVPVGGTPPNLEGSVDIISQGIRAVCGFKIFFEL